MGSNALSMRDLSEIKALKKPPPPIRMLMEVCCLLFHIQPVKLQPHTTVDAGGKSNSKWSLDYWEPARRYLLSDPFFLSKLRMYEAEDISHAQRSKIERYFKDTEFTAERVRNCSKAAYELYEWVRLLLQQRVHQAPTSPRHSPAVSAVARQLSGPMTSPSLGVSEGDDISVHR